jgi:hypothetical protein
MWFARWGLKADPFGDSTSTFVSLPSHVEAVARLVYTIEAGERLALLTGPAGSGKTRVLARAMAEARDPALRLALVSGPVDPVRLYNDLSERLGARAVTASEPGIAFRALVQAVRCCRLQDLQVVLAIDEVASPPGSGELDGMVPLMRLREVTGARVTLLLATGDDPAGESLPAVGSLRPWALAVRVAPLTRSEVEAYLVAKLAAAGCHDSIFTPRAVTRLHLQSAGILRGIDRLASLCLLAGAARGLEAVTAEVVESVFSEYHPPPEEPALIGAADPPARRAPRSSARTR